MRTKVKEIGNKTRERYRATVGRMGIKSNEHKGFPERTILLKDLYLLTDDNEELVTDHLWKTVHKQLKNLDLKEGDVITFYARVSTYKKGYRNKTIDYTLNYMTKIEVIREDRPLQEGEKTSSTEPTWKELWEAQRAARERRFKEEMEECCNYWWLYFKERSDERFSITPPFSFEWVKQRIRRELYNGESGH